MGKYKVVNSGLKSLKQVYDNSWIILMLTDSPDYQQMCGSSGGCAYTIKVSRSQYKNWKMAAGDFISFSIINKPADYGSVKCAEHIWRITS